MLARDVMTTELVTVPPDMPLAAVARLMAERGISGVPVVGPDGALLGMLTEGDPDPPASGGGGEAGLLVRGAVRLAGRTGRPLRQDAWPPRPRCHDHRRAYRQRGHAAREIAALFERTGIRRVPILREGKPGRPRFPCRSAARPAGGRGGHGGGAAQRRRDPPRHRPPHEGTALGRSTYFIFPEVKDGAVTFYGFAVRRRWNRRCGCWRRACRG